MDRVVLIADAGPSAGLGHLARCSALGAALVARSATVTAYGLELGAPTERYGIRWALATGFDDLSADVVVLDSYRADRSLFQALSAKAPLVVFRDEDDAHTDDAALCISTVGSSDEERCLNGPAYACLGPPYWEAPRHEVSDTVGRVLVLTGGGDVAEIGIEIAAGLRASLPEPRIALVRGPFASKAGPAGVELVSDPPGLHDELAVSDLVVTAAGQTLFEALAMGLPVVAIPVAENQRGQLSSLAEAGAVIAVESADQAIEAAVRLVADIEARRGLSRSASAAIDGRGALRVADAILALNQRPRVRLRPVSEADAALLLAWRNDQDTRAFSFTKHEIGDEEHRAWLADRLADLDTLFWIAYDGERPVGQVRLTRDGCAAEIHIAVAPTARGRGYGRTMIREAVAGGVAAWPGLEAVLARIDQANEASVRAFSAAGFRSKEEAEGRLLMEMRPPSESSPVFGEHLRGIT